AREGSPLRGQDRHPDPPGLGVLSSRGASPGILQEGTRALRALSKGLRARREAQGALGRGRGRTLVKRTAIVATLAAVGLALGLSEAARRAQDSKTENKEKKTVRTPNAQTAAKNATGTGASQKPSDAELKKRLTPMQYNCTQEGGTERAFSNEYWDNHNPATYLAVTSH